MDILDRLDHNPEAWRPEPGDKIVGQVVELDERVSDYGGSYPLVTLHTDDGREVVVHGFHTVLKRELAQKKPSIGDRLGIAYHGRDDVKKYERYRVVIDRVQPMRSTEPDWKRIEAEATQEFDVVDDSELEQFHSAELAADNGGDDF